MEPRGLNPPRHSLRLEPSPDIPLQQEVSIQIGNSS